MYKYKNRLIITSVFELYIFDLYSGKLLLNYHFEENTAYPAGTLINNKFICVSSSRSLEVDSMQSSDIFCLDLDSLTITWNRRIPFSEVGFNHKMLHNQKDIIIIPAANDIYLLNINNGETEMVIKTNFQHYGPHAFYIDDQFVYCNCNTDQSTVVCYDYHKKEENWHFKGGDLMLAFNKHVLIYVSEQKGASIVGINGISGKEEKRINVDKRETMLENETDALPRFLILGHGECLVVNNTLFKENR
ncbi:MAG: hypothetical protein M3Q97_01275 [Bacteroidota bacterium]|nr:hypothetical protein [Bacteroidota bacterium]